MPKVVLDQARFDVLGPLIVQLRFESPSTLLDQSYRAEHLIKTIDPARQYPYDFICYKLTDYKPREPAHPQLVPGNLLVRDLAIFIDLVAHQVFMCQDQLPEPAVSARQLAKEYSISLKTLKRWSKLGLVHRCIIGPDALRQSYILKSTWQWFIAKHENLVARAAAFTRMTPDQRQSIVRQAKALYQAGGMSRNRIELALAERTGRARETIRYILTQYDADAGPENRIFPARVRLTEAACRQIAEMYARGVPIGQLARIFGRSEPTIYRVISATRQAAWRDAKIEYIASPEFGLPDADQTILPGADIQVETRPEGTCTRHLGPAEERALFRAYNYLKWKQDSLRQPFLATPDAPIPAETIDQLEQLQLLADQVRGKLIVANQALVVSIAKRHVNPALTLDELLSEGLGPLMKAVEKFDYTRGYKFSTYASWAVMKHFARVVPLAGQHQHQLLAAEDLDALLPGVTEVDEQRAFRRSLAVQGALDHLTDREREILENRFGLTRTDEPLSLAQLGARLGITKERVRQIEAKAMEKLHTILKDSLPEKDE